jgi:hypothetical protein
MRGWPRLLDADSGEVTLFGDDLTLEDVVWMGPHPSIAELAAAGGREQDGALWAGGGGIVQG